MSLEPKDSGDLTGWTEITCWQAELVRRRDLQVVSSRTDMETPDVFTEWWIPKTDNVKRAAPVLREYRDRDGCRHYLAGWPEDAGRAGGQDG
ncbi:hypothetical protein [Kribbella deserti]|uniref:Uncharacterized protein n=1 Tax=Kribbella deserti TaxID=1926257 RepID=A0ABV6QQ57_9ACTN